MKKRIWRRINKIPANSLFMIPGMGRSSEGLAWKLNDDFIVPVQITEQGEIMGNGLAKKIENDHLIVKLIKLD